MESCESRRQVTVVIPNYNGIKYIGNCLESLLAGSMIPEILVVDNGSRDGSAELIRNQFPAVRLLRLRANTGFCHACNVGFRASRTKYVILLNNDTVVDPHFVEKLYTSILQYSRTFSVQARMVSLKDPAVLDDAGDLYCALGWAFARGKGQSVRKYTRKGKIFSACGGAAIYRREVLDRIGYFDERHFCYLEDVDLGYRARIYGYDNRYEPEAIVYHAGSASSGSVHNPFKEEMTAGNNAYLLYKNMPALQYALNAPLIYLGVRIKKSYFKKKGLGEAYEKGLHRGEMLKMRAMAAREEELMGVLPTKESIPVEACFEGKDASAGEILPLYLGGRVPFRICHLPAYVSIQAQLWKNCVLRLKN